MHSPLLENLFATKSKHGIRSSNCSNCHFLAEIFRLRELLSNFERYKMHTADCRFIFLTCFWWQPLGFYCMVFWWVVRIVRVRVTSHCIECFFFWNLKLHLLQICKLLPINETIIINKQIHVTMSFMVNKHLIYTYTYGPAKLRKERRF